MFNALQTDTEQEVNLEQQKLSYVRCFLLNYVVSKKIEIAL